MTDAILSEIKFLHHEKCYSNGQRGAMEGLFVDDGSKKVLIY
jgi:hypothetical protein